VGSGEVSLLATLVVLARIVTNPLSNVFQKQLTQRAAEPIFVIAATHGLLTVAALPLLLGRAPMTLGGAFWTNILIAVALAVAGNTLLVAALRSSDLSVLGPINAYKAVVGLVLAIFLIGEVPTPFGLAGVALIVAGSYFVIDRAPGQARGHAFRQFAADRGVQLRFAALVCSATEAVFLKRALLLSSPLTTFLIWAAAGFPVAAIVIPLLTAGVAADMTRFRTEWRTYLWLALTTGLMQLTTLLSFGMLQVGYSLALFQLSTLITVYLGHRYFQERNIRRRLIGACVMLAGAVLIITLGRRG
jgi:drug/metabolite transporter (DMT)-like permease